LANSYDISNDFNKIPKCAKREKDVPKGTKKTVLRSCGAAVDQLVMACCGHAVLLSLNRAIAKFQHFL
jgi:hypothetical protein